MTEQIRVSNPTFLITSIVVATATIAGCQRSEPTVSAPVTAARDDDNPGGVAAPSNEPVRDTVALGSADRKDDESTVLALSPKGMQAELTRLPAVGDCPTMLLAEQQLLAGPALDAAEIDDSADLRRLPPLTSDAALPNRERRQPSFSIRSLSDEPVGPSMRPPVHSEAQRDPAATRTSSNVDTHVADEMAPLVITPAPLTAREDGAEPTPAVSVPTSESVPMAEVATSDSRGLATVGKRHTDIDSKMKRTEVPRSALANLQLPAGIRERATQVLDHGTQLAERGALYSARLEFLHALRLIAQSLDAQLGVRHHTRALANGLRALEEADDFVAGATSVETDLQVAGFVAGHRTPVLKDAPHDELTPLVAIQQYYRYAHQQLALAGHREPVASAALHALGRVESLLGNSPNGEHGPKSIALYQASLSVDNRNVRAANELGVALARAGQLREAQNVLERATAIRATPAVVANLAEVQRRSNPASMSGAPLSPNARPTDERSVAQRLQVQWVDPNTFTQPSQQHASMTTGPAPAPNLWSGQPSPIPRRPANVATSVGTTGFHGNW